ncbi:MAG: hypothetical protein Q8O56_17490 [Solirubrobacteraceae bacterium]|nr:hypothetical protein [Solirubrobacteraceae bacterium]
MKRRARPDRLLLVAGAVLAAFGVVLVLDRTDAIDLTFGAIAPMLFGVVGAILLATGLTRRE